MNDWISVEDGLPDEWVKVLLAIEYEDSPVVGYYRDGSWEACTNNHGVSCAGHCYGGMVEGNFKSKEVTHYMPLPEPPK